MPPIDAETAAWFAAEIQPHEAMLRSWLKSQFPRATFDVDDVVQEAYTRVFALRQKGQVRAPKALLFAIARNLILTELRRHTIVPHLALDDIASSGILDEDANVPHTVARAQELAMLTEAIQALPTRCRQIITLRKIYGLSLRETAKELGITEHTVVLQTIIGLRKIGEFFRTLNQPKTEERS